MLIGIIIALILLIIILASAIVITSKQKNTRKRSSKTETTEAREAAVEDTQEDYDIPGTTAEIKKGWEESYSGIRYYDDNGEAYRSDWYMINDEWYYFNDNGFLLTEGMTPDGVMTDENGHPIYNSNTDNNENETGSSNISQEYIFPQSSVQYLSDYDLSGKGEWECLIARNEIYARHGRRFKRTDLQDYFNGCSWYNGTIAPDNFTDSMLSQIEKENIKKILTYEKAHHYNKQ